MNESQSFLKVFFEVFKKNAKKFREFPLEDMGKLGIGELTRLGNLEYPKEILDFLKGLKVIFFCKNQPVPGDVFLDVARCLGELAKNYDVVRQSILSLQVPMINQVICTRNIADLLTCIDAICMLSFIDLRNVWTCVHNKLQMIVNGLVNNPKNYLKIVDALKKCKSACMDVKVLSRIIVLRIVKYVENLSSCNEKIQILVNKLEGIDDGQYATRIIELKNKHHIAPMENCIEDLMVSDINCLEKYISSARPFYVSQNNTEKQKVEIFLMQTSSGVNLAVKSFTFLPHQTAAIENEVFLLKSLSRKKPCFLDFFTEFQKKAQFYVITEYCQNTLQKDIEQRKSKNSLYSDEEQKLIISTLIEGFAYMSAFNIFHRDIKPENILFNGAKLKIIDFGLSIILPSSQTRKGTFPVEGTPTYVSPELQPFLLNKLILGEEVTLEYDLEKADVFSLGLVLIQVLTLANVNGLNTLENQEKLTEVISDLKGWTKHLIKAMLKFDPNKRCNLTKALSYIPMNKTLHN